MGHSLDQAKLRFLLTLFTILVHPCRSNASDPYLACLEQVNKSNQSSQYMVCHCTHEPGRWMVCEPDYYALFHGLHPERHGIHIIDRTHLSTEE